MTDDISKRFRLIRRADIKGSREQRRYDYFRTQTQQHTHTHHHHLPHRHTTPHHATPPQEAQRQTTNKRDTGKQDADKQQQTLRQEDGQADGQSGRTEDVKLKKMPETQKKKIDSVLRQVNRKSPKLIGNGPVET